eukprot:4342648-Pleurochrysis_carterae.AAC.1
MSSAPTVVPDRKDRSHTRNACLLCVVVTAEYRAVPSVSAYVGARREQDSAEALISSLPPIPKAQSPGTGLLTVQHCLRALSRGQRVCKND